MGIGTIILFALAIGEVVSLVKIKKQGKRIEELEEKAGVSKK
jgi:hypothetical protein